MPTRRHRLFGVKVAEINDCSDYILGSELNMECVLDEGDKIVAFSIPEGSEGYMLRGLLAMVSELESRHGGL